MKLEMEGFTHYLDRKDRELIAILHYPPRPSSLVKESLRVSVGLDSKGKPVDCSVTVASTGP